MSEKRQEKKAQFTGHQGKGGIGKIITIAVLVVVAGAVAAFMLPSQVIGDGYQKVKSENGEVRIDLSSVHDGQARFYKYAANNGEIKFFVVKSTDGVFRAAFDACDVCYRSEKGYRQEGDFMVCNNCNQKFRTDLVNEIKGGCNPAPLQRRVENKQLVISDHDVLLGAGYFGG